jgi:uncharacterized RDD family membrane protein YckC
MEPKIQARISMILRRIAAAFVEIVLLPLFAVFLILTIPDLSKDPSVAFAEGAYFLFIMAVWLAIFTYILFKDAFFNGRSIMKKLLGLRVVSAKTQVKCRWYQSLIRNIPLFITPVLLIELLMVIFNPGGRRLGDMMAGTVVVNANESFLPKPKPQKRIGDLGLKTLTWLLAAALILVLFYIAYNSIGAGNISERLNKSSNSVVTIYSYDRNNKFLGYASGFFVNSEGYVVTSQHVVEGAARSFAIYKENENLAIDSMIANDPTRDIAILKVRAVDTPALRLGNSDKVDVGNEIYTIGAPQGLLNTISKGIISQIRYSKGVKYIQIDAPISPGSSGGPLLDRNLDVIGVNFAYFKEGQNLNFAIPVNYIKALLKKSKVNYK